MKTAAGQSGARRIRVGIIGANPDRGWAAQAHIPALRSLSGDFEITALSTTRRQSADAAGKLFGVPLTFDNHRELVNSPAVDVVAVTVKVPYHLELATAALEAGKAVYCEWPLGNGLKEAETLAALAKKQGVLAVAGLQARSAPAVVYVRDLVEQGYVGEVLSTTLVGSGMGWGPTVEPFNAYLNEKKNGATMLSIAVLARAPARARAISVGAAARPRHERRASVRAFCPRLSRGNPSLPNLRRRGHAPSHAECDRDGSGDRPSSNGRLIRTCASLRWTLDGLSCTRASSPGSPRVPAPSRRRPASDGSGRAPGPPRRRNASPAPTRAR